MKPAIRVPAADGAPALGDAIRPGIRADDAARARRWLAELQEVAAAAGAGEEARARLGGDLGRFVAAVMDCSPFLRALILDDPQRLFDLLGRDADAAFADLILHAHSAWRDAEDDAGLMRSLRRLRAGAALLIALADLGGVWAVDRVVEALTAFADAALGAAVAHILKTEHEAGRIVLPDPANSERGSGWIVLAMGKHGAGELNYSSDIDLIALFDPAIPRLGDGEEPALFFVRATKRLVKLLQERTADGYVFRVDLRLRPDPGSTAVAISTHAALQYYEANGQNWERAALIKARPAAGDIAAGEAFLHELVPFIWRKYLDFAAIADIHSIKRQIHDYRGHAVVAIAGHNLKLGRGGIREIEFFVQTQQLIAGGRNPRLRGRRTLDLLAELAAEDWITPETARDLAAAYRYLRTVEHRLQMIADEQTHTLPEDEEGLATVAHLLGLTGPKRLAERLRPVLESVEEYYARLFESAPSLSAPLGSLVFTGEDENPETLQTLARMGYANPTEISRTVRSWHFGRYAATRSATARVRLTEVMPALLEALARNENADIAFNAFDRLLSRMPAGLQLFSLLGSNPELLGLLATILATAQRLAETVGRRPHVLDVLLEPAFYGAVPTRRTLTASLAATLGQARSYEDALDRARVFGQEQSFLIGARLIAGTISARRAGAAYADLADLLVADLFARVQAEFEAAHGRVPGGKVALIAMGKLGGREMTAASDLDLILLYDARRDAAGSDGPRPLTVGQYYARLTQRLVAALSAPTAEGKLYEVDFRLRPSGNAGPLATRIDAFAQYQAAEAWTWEHMALTRARPTAGDAALTRRAAKVIAETIGRERDRRKTLADILEMRGMVEAEKGSEGIWDLKQAPGGMVDIEFIAQALQLLHAAGHPEILSVETEAALTAAARADLLPPGDGDVLLPALRLYQNLTQIVRLCVEGTFRPEEAPRGLLDLLARAAEQPDFGRLDALLRESEAAVRAVFVRQIGKVKAA